MVARYGGDEFIAIAHGASRTEAVRLAERLRDAARGVRRERQHRRRRLPRGRRHRGRPHRSRRHGPVPGQRSRPELRPHPRRRLTDSNCDRFQSDRNNRATQPTHGIAILGTSAGAPQARSEPRGGTVGMAQPKIQPAAQQAIKRHPVQVRATFLRLPRRGHASRPRSRRRACCGTRAASGPNGLFRPQHHTRRIEDRKPLVRQSGPRKRAFVVPAAQEVPTTIAPSALGAVIIVWPL